MLVLPFSSIAQNRSDYHHGGGGRGGGRTEIMGEPGSALTVFADNGERFYLMVNGIKQNMYPQSRVRIEGLPQVTNDIQVIFDDNQTRAISKTITFADPADGKAINLTLRIARENGMAFLRFQKAAPLEHGYRAEQNEYVMAYGKDMGPQRQAYTTPPPPPPAPVPAGPVAMDDRSFKGAVDAIMGASFDESKLSTAKTIAASNYFTTDQVMEICRLFAFDDTKVAFAQYAYKRTVDNNVYYKVNSVFSFDSDKQKMNDFVNNNRGR